MSHKTHHKRSKSLKRRLKRMAAAAAVAGVAFVSSAMLPGMPATAHASAAPDITQQQMVKTSQGTFGMQTDSKIPQKKLDRMKAKEAAQRQLAKTQAGAKDKAPVTHAVAKNVAARAASAPVNFTKIIDNVRATAYAPGAHDNGQWGNKTYLGTTVRPGIIAVDPNIIPLGSRVFIEYPDGTGTYAVAEDTGGAIKGNRIDVAVNSVAEAYDFGIQKVKVYVVGQA